MSGTGTAAAALREAYPNTRAEEPVREPVVCPGAELPVGRVSFGGKQRNVWGRGRGSLLVVFRVAAGRSAGGVLGVGRQSEAPLRRA